MITVPVSFLLSATAKYAWYTGTILLETVLLNKNAYWNKVHFRLAIKSYPTEEMLKWFGNIDFKNFVVIHLTIDDFYSSSDI